MIDFSQNHWNVITHCARKNVWDEWIPAEWFVLNGPHATREEAEKHQAAVEANTAGTDADWPEAYAAKQFVHDDELGKYGLNPLNPPKREKTASLSSLDRFLEE